MQTITITKDLFPEPMFVVPFTSKWGETIEVADPSRESFKQMIVLHLSKASNVRAESNGDGSLTVKADNIASITYVPKGWKRE